MNRKFWLFILILITFFIAQSCLRKVDEETSLVDLELIKICKWKDNASTCVMFTFDDSNKSSINISKVLEKYNFKSTFFVIASDLYTKDLKEMIANGHEIGNHTYSHINLKTADSSKVDFEIRMGKETIENALKIKCVSFAEPGGQKTPMSTRAVFRYHLFDRNYSEFQGAKRNFISYSDFTNVEPLMKSLRNAINEGSILVIEGHGMDGDGYMPMSKVFFIQTLDSLKKYTNNEQVWLTTVKEGSQYENLYHEISLEKKQLNNTLTFTFKGYNKEKYKDLLVSPISIEIPNILSEKLSCLTDSIQITKLTDKFVFTLDLKRNTNIVMKIN
ncbi:MAG: hypothetical protein A2W90_16585 [Bacteroidetes bacterium GWF2_42_66]|nr:MAG: hypothetical protein A2W92_04030 [Bacteroidetes bacterium GWA2_42_15]OFX96311.1 MAG: hypothetical protein A2W89_05515 [Bacteroidetes bacterium GWE2_42_39]OFY46350.1 MAG: hypothetical protein A2W90_16585 [Bacteroidetes bacterium GWF2_42_66]HBL78264.1 hypothetical protein [Prolixibacteraceae bacterium]HCU60130.1 hypothetical protein [Prolixibacteraceae bacterium]